QDAPARILAIAWSPNNQKLAICNSERTVLLFDENGERKDKFPTKPSDPKNGRKSYTVKGLAFSPDSTKIAVGQTDNIIYVYKIGEEWGEKKVISNKFTQQSPVTCLIWLTEGPIVYGQADGKVRAAHVKANKSQTFFATNSLVVSLASNIHGTGFISGHADGTIVRYYVAEDSMMEQQGRIAVHSSPPYALCWPAGFVFACGCDRRIAVYERDGRLHKQFDYPTEKEFTVACSSPSGQAVAVGSFNRIRIYAWSTKKMTWEETSVKEMENMYTITALSWKRDGSRVTCGALCGSVELFESVLKRTVWKNKFELTYVGPSQVLVKPLNSEARGVILKSQLGYEIDDVRILGDDRYLIARTPETLLLGDLHRNLLSEVSWPNSGRMEKFYLENQNVCLIFNAGELNLIEYGNNDILGSVRTEFMNPHLVSVRINERRQLNSTEDNKKLAYLLDKKTICIVDLVLGMPILQVSHDSKIDWLELNETSHKLLFRDKKMRLTLLDTRSGDRLPILSYCTFVQWVTGSDVAVAQSRNNACVWYNIDTPDRITTFAIRGEIIDVVRQDGKTEILTQEGTHQLGYELDEGLVEFGTAVHDSDFGRAILFLESLSLTGNKDTEAMWQNLAEIALQLHNLRVALRCYAALGDMPKMFYLSETLKIADEYAKENGGDGMDCPEVWARMAILGKQLKTAENVYLEQNQLEKALDMYKSLHKWEDAVNLAEASGYSQLKELKEEYENWLLSTGQEEKAGHLKEEAGDLRGAVELYILGNVPVAAGRVVQSNDELLKDRRLVSSILSKMEQMGLHQQAGHLSELSKDVHRALTNYRKAHAYATALQLAKNTLPEELVNLEEEWGDYLLSTKQMDAAINHFIEAGKTVKAIEAAIMARQWKKAVQILQDIEDVSIVYKYYTLLAKHFASVKDFALAENLYTQSGLYNEAIQMYMDSGEWEKAFRLGNQYLDESELSMIFTKEGQAQEALGNYAGAEQLYVLCGKHDTAIAMYKTLRQYDEMLRLVKQHHPDLVSTTYLHLAQQLENEGDIVAAQEYFIEAGEWKMAVKMLRSHNMWEQAYKVAKQAGGEQASNQVAFLWAKSLGGDSAIKLLSRLDLLESCIDYACDTYQFDFAFELAKSGMKDKTSDIHYKYAMTLEDDGKFQLAEEHFVKAGKPKEAVLMYIHSKDWESAERVAEMFDELALVQVLLAQAKHEFGLKNFSKFESLLLRAHKPELIVQQYQDSGQWVDALRVCRDYMPSRLAALQAEYEQEVGSRGTRDVGSLFSEAKQWENNGQYLTAVQCYLKVNSTNCNDSTVILKALNEASRITNTFLDSDEISQIIKILCGRLVDMKQYNMAAQLFLGADLIKEAIDTLIYAEEWQKARKIANELEPGFIPYVESRYKESLRTQGKADQLADVDIVSALDLLCEQGHWQKVLDTARPHGPNILNKYTALYATHLIKGGFTEKALELYTRFEPAPLPQNYNIYRRIAADSFSIRRDKEDFNTWAQLRDMFYQITVALNSTTDAGTPVYVEFEKIMLIAHYYSLRCAARNVPSLEKIVTKISISLLRFSDIIPADKAYYEAGIDAKAQGLNTEGFIFLNHCLDIVEAIEEAGDGVAVDYTDLADTDFPQDVPLPETSHLMAQEIEDIKQWVLSISMDSNIEMVLPTDDRGVYPACLKSPNGSVAPACVVTGYPILGGSGKRGGGTLALGDSGIWLASRDDWNSLGLAYRLEPTNTELANVIAFFTKWTGAEPTVSFM
ncbi:hypothetical protein AAG570_013823, partial [Ranatra chinensis]